MRNYEKPLTVGIIGGKGKMGSLFANIFSRADCRTLISDKNTALTNEKLVQKADVVIVSVPIDQTTVVIKKIVQHMRPNQLLTDITSVKEEPLKAMLKSRSAVIGLHPLFNDTTYRSGQTIVVCPERPGHWLPWLENIFKKEGLIIKKLSPKRHDELMAFSQALVHGAEIVFGRTLEKLHTKAETFLPFSGPASEIKVLMAARVLAQDANLYGNIQLANPANQVVQKKFFEAAKEFADIIEKKDFKRFNEYFETSARHLGDFRHAAMKETDVLIANYLENRSAPPQKREKKENPENSIAVLGPALTFTDIAAERWKKLAKRATEKIYAKSIAEVFELVEKGHAKEGIVPLENRLNGSVRETLDLLFYKNLRIIGTLKIPIRHALCAHPNAQKKSIRTIISHPQTWRQCSRFIQKHFPHAELLEAPSTVSAMEKVGRLKDEKLAAIGNEKAAVALGLKVLVRNIENDPENETEFAVIEIPDRERSPKAIFPSRMTPRIKTSIVFHFSKDSPGNLSKIFQIFAKNSINLTKIESRPTGKKFGDYLFFLDLEGSESDAKVKTALQVVKRQVKKLKILGSYQASVKKA